MFRGLTEQAWVIRWDIKINKIAHKYVHVYALIIKHENYILQSVTHN